MESKKNIEMKLFMKQKWTHRQKTNLWLPKCKEWGEPLAAWRGREREEGETSGWTDRWQIYWVRDRQ